MGASGIFISVLLVLLVFNWVYVATDTNLQNNIILGAITSLVTTAIILSIATGIQILGSGLNSASIKIIFGVSALLQILFSLNFSISGSDFNIGLGLINNVFNAFSVNDLFGVGFFIATVLSIVALVSGLMVIIGSSD